MKGIRKIPPKPKFEKPWGEIPPREYNKHERVKIFDAGPTMPVEYLKKYPPMNIGPIILHERYNLNPFYTTEEKEVYELWKSIVKTVTINCERCRRALGVIEVPYDVKVDLRLTCPACKAQMGYRLDPEYVKLKDREKGKQNNI